ncbi:MAG: 4a-hydroxytetrahydrobiopterin dehydratase [Sandaracinaceae bacterium]|nr:4a-hydroxytetrahydrobiopterin dehydratase [Sandaracinaceae bacterium]
MPHALSDDAIRDALAELPGWRHEGSALRKRFTFGGFPEAISFITRIAFDAERLDHHPELRNVYGTVDVALTTHDAGNRVTERDVALARRIEAISWV